MRALGAFALVSAAAALCFSVARYGLGPIAGYDIFWHIATGDEILRTRTTLPTDPFSYTVHGQPWPYKDAGAAVLIAVIHRAGGMAALVAYKAFVFAAAMATIVASMVRYRAIAWPLALAVTALVVEATAFRFHERPQSIAFMLTALVALLIERHRAGAGSLYWVIPVTILLANLHRGALVLPVLVSAYAASRMIEARFREVHAPAAELLLSSIGSALACLATPFGLRIFSSSAQMLGESAYRELIPEWYPTTLAHLSAASPASVAFLGLAALSIAARWRHWDLWDLSLLALACLLGFRSVRFIPFIALLGCGPVATGLRALPVRFDARLASVLASLGCFAGAALALGSDLPPPRLGLEPQRHPDRAIQFVRETRVTGQPLNDFRFGGYLIQELWPRYRVYVDGRNDLVYSAEQLRIAAHVLDHPASLESEHRRYGFEWILAHTEPESTGRAWLDTDPRWRLVFVSQPAVLYVRADGPNAEIARERGYGVIRAFDLRRSIEDGLGSPSIETRQRTISEIQRMLADDPGNYYAHLAMVLARTASAAAH